MNHIPDFFGNSTLNPNYQSYKKLKLLRKEKKELKNGNIVRRHSYDCLELQSPLWGP